MATAPANGVGGETGVQRSRSATTSSSEPTPLTPWNGGSDACTQSHRGPLLLLVERPTSSGWPDLPKKTHNKFHRDVLFGRQPIQFISVKLPHSHKEYIRRYNEEIERKVKEVQLAETMRRAQSNDSDG